MRFTFVTWTGYHELISRVCAYRRRFLIRYIHEVSGQSVLSKRICRDGGICFAEEQSGTDRPFSSIDS
jgi:hypothetical protein